MLRLLAICSLVLLANAQFSYNVLKDIQERQKEYIGAGSCCAPDQWEGSTSTVSSIGPTVKVSNVSFDFNNQRVASQSNVFSLKHKKKIMVRSVADFKAKQLYIIFDKKGKNVCHKVKLGKKQMKKPCVPAKFKLVGKYYLGSSSAGDRLNMRAYGHARKTKKGGQLSVLLSTTEKCTPVSVAINLKRKSIRRKNRSVHAVTSFFNITPGIKKPSVFDLPESCKAKKTTNQVFREHHKFFKLPKHINLDKLKKLIKKFKPTVGHHSSTEHLIPAHLHDDINSFVNMLAEHGHL